MQAIIPLAKASDDGGLSTTSQSVGISVSTASVNLAPTIQLTSPTAGSNFTAAATISTANASDADGSIVKVEFYNGNNKIGEDNTAPYSIVWNDVSAGNYTITAKAAIMAD